MDGKRCSVIGPEYFELSRLNLTQDQEEKYLAVQYVYNSVKHMFPSLYGDLVSGNCDPDDRLDRAIDDLEEYIDSFRSRLGKSWLKWKRMFLHLQVGTLEEVENPYLPASPDRPTRYVKSVYRRPGSFVHKGHEPGGREACDPQDPFDSWIRINLSIDEANFHRLLPACGFRSAPLHELQLEEIYRIQLEPLLYICDAKDISGADFGYNLYYEGQEQMVFRCVWLRRRPTWEPIGHLVDGALSRVFEFFKLRPDLYTKWQSRIDLTSNIFIQNGIKFFVNKSKLKNSGNFNFYLQMRHQEYQFAVKNHIPYFALEDLQRFYFTNSYKLSCLHLVSPQTKKIPKLGQVMNNDNWPWVVTRDHMNRRLTAYITDLEFCGACMQPPQWTKWNEYLFPNLCKIDLRVLDKSVTFPSEECVMQLEPELMIPNFLLPEPDEHVLMRLRKILMFIDFMDVTARCLLDSGEMPDFVQYFGDLVERQVGPLQTFDTSDDELIAVMIEDFADACQAPTRGQLTDERLTSDHFFSEPDLDEQDPEIYFLPTRKEQEPRKLFSTLRKFKRLPVKRAIMNTVASYSVSKSRTSS